MTKQKNVSHSNYQFYATLLDAYQNYLDAETNWENFYGGSDDPKYSIDEYVALQEQELIDRINRVPFESEAADKGTAFNEVIDCCILGRNTAREDMKISKDETCVYVAFKDYNFAFDKKLVSGLSADYAGAVSQYKCVGVLSTKYGDVTLYGYIDELLPCEIHDIKTTANYSAFKFRNHWQHLVYPYCMRYEGVELNTFQYDVIKWGKDEFHWSIMSELYEFSPERDEARLRLHVEGLIEFILYHKDKIIDKKIFNCLDGQDEKINKYGIRK